MVKVQVTSYLKLTFEWVRILLSIFFLSDRIISPGKTFTSVTFDMRL